jgi:hypothetical protein
MSIHFTCAKCGKKLFAQDRFAGRSVACPACQTPNMIPAAGGLIDMEQGHLDDAQSVSPDEPASGEPAAGSGGGRQFIQQLESQSDPAVRWERRWRMAARAATGLTIGWLIYLFLIIVSQQETSAPAAIFDVMLIGGLIVSMKQMKNGPYHVFLAAALAVTLSMPILSQLLQPIDDRAFDQLTKQMQPVYKENPEVHPLSQEQWNQMFWSLTSMAGLFFSIPLWITSAKVAALQRLRDRRK